MDSYRAQLSKEFEFYGSLENSYFKDKINLFNKLRYTIFLLNGTGCTLIVTINRDDINKVIVGTNNIWSDAFQIFLIGVLVAFGAIMAASAQLMHLEIYAKKIREYKEIELRLVSKFEDYVRGNNYSRIFSPFSWQYSFIENQTILQQLLAKYENLREANYYNFDIGSRCETISISLCVVSYLVFGYGIDILFPGKYVSFDGDIFIYFQHWLGMAFPIILLVVTVCIVIYNIKKIVDLVDNRTECYKNIKEKYKDLL